MHITVATASVLECRLSVQRATEQGPAPTVLRTETPLRTVATAPTRRRFVSEEYLPP
jgi:hypothetical protein